MQNSLSIKIIQLVMNNANEVIKRSSKICRDFTNEIDWKIKVHPIIKMTATFVKHRWEKAFKLQTFERISLFSASRQLLKVSRAVLNQIRLSITTIWVFIIYLGYGRNKCANTHEQNPLVAVSNFPLFELKNICSFRVCQPNNINNNIHCPFFRISKGAKDS